VNCFRRPGDFPEPRFWIAERTDGGAEQLPGRRLLNHYFRVAEAPGRRREAGAEGSADRLVRSAHCHATLEIRALNTACQIEQGSQVDFLHPPPATLLLAIQSAALSSDVRFGLSTLSPNLRSLLKGNCRVTAAPGGKTESEAVGRVQGVSLRGGEMEDDAASGDRRGRIMRGSCSRGWASS